MSQNGKDVRINMIELKNYFKLMHIYMMHIRVI